MGKFSEINYEDIEESQRIYANFFVLLRGFM
jgi:hypothetical protein